MEHDFTSSPEEQKFPTQELPEIPQEDAAFTDLLSEPDFPPFAASDEPQIDHTIQIPAVADESELQSDPLQDVSNLPSLFPNEQHEASVEPQAPATVVPRPKRKNRRTWRIIRRILISVFKWTLALALAVAILAAGLVAYLTVTEYSPAEREKAQSGNTQVNVTYDGNHTLRIVSFNTGYGGLGEDSDFFMDGGNGVTPESEELVLQNMSGMKRILSDIDADIMFLQEVDTDSKRSYEKNQWRQYEYEFPEYESAFALNYSCDFVPYPIGDFMGEVHSGLATYSRFDIVSATRISLPTDFSWPTRVANLKRCLLVTRLDIAGREQQLVLVNCHLEAYDDGDAKRAQTEQLLAFIREEYRKGNYVIVGGDFNQTFPNSNAFPIVKDENWAPGTLTELPSEWHYAYDDKAPTCRLLDKPYDPKDAQYYVIDGFILSPNVQLRRVETIDEGFVYSDHNPVVLDITLK